MKDLIFQRLRDLLAYDDMAPPVERYVAPPGGHHVADPETPTLTKLDVDMDYHIPSRRRKCRIV